MNYLILLVVFITRNKGQCSSDSDCSSFTNQALGTTICNTDYSFCTVECDQDDDCSSIGVDGLECDTTNEYCTFETCSSNNDCSGLTPNCNNATGACYPACTDDNDCTVSPLTTCETTTGVCVSACSSDSLVLFIQYIKIIYFFCKF